MSINRGGYYGWWFSGTETDTSKQVLGSCKWSGHRGPDFRRLHDLIQFYYLNLEVHQTLGLPPLGTLSLLPYTSTPRYLPRYTTNFILDVRSRWPTHSKPDRTPSPIPRTRDGLPTSRPTSVTLSPSFFLGSSFLPGDSNSPLYRADK